MERQKVPQGYRESLPWYWQWLERLICRYLQCMGWERGSMVDVWVFGRAIVVGELMWLVPHEPGTYWRVAAFLLISVVLLDILFYQTGVVLTGNWPASRVRMLVLAFVGYFTIGLAFGVLYALQAGAFNCTAGKLDLIYFSFVTLATIGYGDLHPQLSRSMAEATVVAEHLLGLYYIAVVVVVIVNMTTDKKGTAE